MDAILKSLAFNPQAFLLQLVLFVVVIVLMNALFWKPLLAHLAAREAHIAGIGKTIQEAQREMETLRADYLNRIAQVEAEARARIQNAIREAQTERERLMAESRTQAEAAIQQGVADMERERIEALESLRERMVALALQAAGKALGPAVDSVAMRRSIEDSIKRVTGDGANPALN